MIQARIFAVAAAALALGLSACGTGGNAQAPAAAGGGNVVSNPTPPESTGQPGTSQPTPPSPPPSTEVPAPPPQTSTPAHQAPDNGLCKAADLRLSFGSGDGAAGTTYRPLIFTNVSGERCTIQGFPGVSYVGGDDGHQVGAAAFREGGKGPAVSLEPGAQASATIGFTNVENYDPADCRPEQARGLRIYPPQETASMFIPFDHAETGCANENLPGNQLKVQTVKPGTAG